jgi:hypothetical protein
MNSVIKNGIGDGGLFYFIRELSAKSERRSRYRVQKIKKSDLHVRVAEMCAIFSLGGISKIKRCN